MEHTILVVEDEQGIREVSLGKEINANKNHKDKSKVCYVLYVFICHKLSP